MKMITQSIEYEGNNASKLKTALKEFHELQLFATGVDWESQYLWATMSDEQALIFCLKYPQYAGRFTTV